MSGLKLCVGVDEQTTKTVPAMTEEVQDALIKNIRRRMTPQPLKIRADIELKCFQFDGVLHIKVTQMFLLMVNVQCVEVGDIISSLSGWILLVYRAKIQQNVYGKNLMMTCCCRFMTWLE